MSAPRPAEARSPVRPGAVWGPRGRLIAAFVALAAGLFLLYGGALRTGFLNDDYLFLEEARSRPLAVSLTRLGALGNFYRPLSRQLYFEALAPVAGGDPRVFHAVNFAVFLGALALLADLLLACVPAAAAFAGLAAFALLPFQRVNLMWISCSQDLLALCFSLLALALHRRGRARLAAGATLLALASKESALPLAFALVAWDGLALRRPWGEALKRATPALVVTALWLGVLAAMRAAHPAAAAFVRWDAGSFLAGWVHEAQSLLGLDDPAGFAAGLASTGPAPFALAGLAAAILLLPEPAAAPPGRVAARELAIFAAAWLFLFGAVTGPVAHSWSAYYYTLCGVGAALLVALLSRGIGRWGLLPLAAALLWWHAGSNASRAFAVADDPWTPTSHLTSFYFERAGALTRTLSKELVRLEPAPAPGTRFFFATLPTFAGFQMGNGALIRSLYRDPTLASHFYTEYSESTAAGHTARFLYWNGVALEPLYGANTRDPLFQVGSDLLLLGRPAGAAHAFRTGLAHGGDPRDHLYWLGWAAMFGGDRPEAEGAWSAWGAVDDSAAWFARLREAQTEYLAGRDTVKMQRLLLEAIRSGIGRPQGHATLAPLLARRSPKYSALEYLVAAWLDPADRFAQRGLALTLAAAHLDGEARAAFAELERRDPAWRADTAAVAVRARLEARRGGGGGVMRF